MENNENNVPSIDEIQDNTTTTGEGSVLDEFNADDLPSTGESTNGVQDSIETQIESNPEVESPSSQEDDASNDDYYLNDNGDVVSSDGTVIVEKDNVEYDDEGQVILPVENSEVDRLQTSLMDELGIELIDEQGQALKFENTDEGAVELVKHAATQLQQQFETQLFEQYPQAADLIRHIKTGKPAESFFDVPKRWRQTVVGVDTNENKEYNKSVRRDILLNKEMISRAGGNINNLSDEQLAALRNESASYVDYLMTSGNVEAKADEALNYLRNWEQSIENARNQQNQQILQEREQQAQQFWGKVNETVASGNLGVFGIPKNEREAFYEYISKPVDEYGNTQEMLDIEQEDVSYRLIGSYLRFHKYDRTKAFNSILREEKAKELQGRKRKRVKLVKQGEGVRQPKNTGLDGIDLDSML